MKLNWEVLLELEWWSIKKNLIKGRSVLTQEQGWRAVCQGVPKLHLSNNSTWFSSTTSWPCPHEEPTQMWNHGGSVGCSGSRGQGGVRWSLWWSRGKGDEGILHPDLHCRRGSRPALLCHDLQYWACVASPLCGCPVSFWISRSLRFMLLNNAEICFFCSTNCPLSSVHSSFFVSSDAIVRTTNHVQQKEIVNAGVHA